MNTDHVFVGCAPGVDMELGQVSPTTVGYDGYGKLYHFDSLKTQCPPASSKTYNIQERTHTDNHRLRKGPFAMCR